jgi:hypothetical protein
MKNSAEEICDVIASDKLREGLVSYKCSNGDLYMDGVETSPRTIETTTLKVPHAGKIAYINAIMDTVRAHGARPVIVLEPARSRRYVFSRRSLAGLVRADMIDLSDLQIPDNMWGDTGHLNVGGRELYTRALGRRLAPLLK